MNAFLSIAPPTHRVAEMVALIRACVLTPVEPEMHVAIDGDYFSAQSPRVGNAQVPTQCLIDARLWLRDRLNCIPAQQGCSTSGARVLGPDPHGALYSLQSFGDTFASSFGTPIGIK